MEEIQKTENQARAQVPGIIRAESATGDLRLHEFRAAYSTTRDFSASGCPRDTMIRKMPAAAILSST